MNYVALIFGGVILFVMLFFGINASQVIIDNTNISATDSFSDNHNTTTEVAVTTFTLMSYIPYLMFITALLGVVLLLVKLM